MKLQRFNKFKTGILLLFLHFNIVELLLLELLVEFFYENFVAKTFFNSSRLVGFVLVPKSDESDCLIH